MSQPRRGDGWQSFFWTLFKRTRNAVALLDDNARFVEVNGAFLQLVKRKRADILGRPVRDVIAGPRRSLREWRAMVARGEWTGETDLVCGDGSHVAVEFAANPEEVTGRRLVLVVVLHSHHGRRRLPHPTREDAPHGPLTERERQIVHMVAMGLTSAEIGEELHITYNTVRTHVNNAMAKVGARSRAQLVAVSVAEDRLRPDGGK
jgi:PAS domain S-box-containing protein